MLKYLVILDCLKQLLFGCAVVTTYHAIKAVRDVSDLNIAVIGVGGVGIHLIKLARIMDASNIIAIDIDERKEDLAYEYGADIFINPRDRDLVDEVVKTTKMGVDVLFEFVGSEETVKIAIGVLKKGGKAVIAGLINKEVKFNFYDIISTEKTVIGIEDHTHNELVELVKLISKHKVDLSKSVAHIFPLNRLEEAIEKFHRRDELIVRIVLKN